MSLAVAIRSIRFKSESRPLLQTTNALAFTNDYWSRSAFSAPSRLYTAVKNSENSSSNAACKPRRVAIVGSGPAGRTRGRIHIDMLEAQPIPYGLARYGVAPDHPEVKSVIHKFEKLAVEGRFRYFGGVRVGTALTIEELRARYAAVVLAYGAEQDRTLRGRFISARDFVGWYNGLPQCQALGEQIKAWLATSTSAVVVGAGNVALDVARILLMPRDELARTDITAAAMEALRDSQIKQVHLVQRRGPLQVAFTSKELREMIQLPDTRLALDLPYLKSTLKEAAPILAKERPRKRLMELLLKGAEAGDKNTTATRSWHLHFLRSPIEFLTERILDTIAHHSSGHSAHRLVGVRLQHNQLIDGRAVSTNDEELLPCELAFKSIGYRSTPIEGVPFDDQLCIVPNERGHRFVPGLYVAGWLKQTADSLLEDTAQLAQSVTSSNTLSDLPDLLKDKHVRYLTFNDWQQLDAYEVAQGELQGKPREKL
ncbi:hypothetical protein BDF19DRAFT_429365 [Syncephalis fuscata]|nr:hypothetical protein BDF19DRAFT_429365 [Syncephalis fuscata]